MAQFTKQKIYTWDRFTIFNSDYKFVLEITFQIF